jgi:hypothetical protein
MTPDQIRLCITALRTQAHYYLVQAKNPDFTNTSAPHAYRHLAATHLHLADQLAQDLPDGDNK